MANTPNHLLMQQVHSILARKEGSFLTRKARYSASRRAVAVFARFQLCNLRQVRTRHLVALVTDYLEDGHEVRSAQNLMAHVRYLLRKSGRGELLRHPHTTNDALGISGGSRSGVREPLQEVVMQDFVERAVAIEPGVASVIELGFHLGLRVQEAVMSAPDLPRWESVLANATAELTEIRVMRGTKGGRIRSVPVFNIAGARAAVQRAIAVAATNGGHLLPGILPQALSRVYTVCSDMGMVGASSPHSARYAYCCGLIVHLHAAGWSERETLGRAANALGHGAQRTDWVRTVYGQTVRDLWQPDTRGPESTRTTVSR